MNSDTILGDQLANLLNGGNAHLDLSTAFADIPTEYYGRRIPESPHTLWRLLEHIRLCQWDILEYCQNPNHISPEFPDGYWPKGDGPSSPSEWDESLKSLKKDLDVLTTLVKDPRTDLFATLPGTDGHNVLREVLIVADHNAYHLGQVVELRRFLGIWPE